MRNAVLIIAALLAMLVGVAFLTTAAMVGLGALYGTAIAALIVGGVYLAFGLILLAIVGSARSRAAPPPQKTPPAPEGTADFPAVIQAFIQGMTTGATAASNRKS